jgi:hypothetical protein
MPALSFHNRAEGSVLVGAKGSKVKNTVADDAKWTCRRVVRGTVSDGLTTDAVLASGW